jgi:phosphatidate cytidylyltransferase
MKKEFQKRILSSLIIIPIALFFVAEGSVFFIFFLSIFFITTSYEWLKMIKKNNLIKIFGIIFLLISFYSTYLSREILGLNYFLFIILICISTDMGGYFFGKTFKGPKLTKISPNKTYAGALGSFILSIITGLIFNQYFASIDVSSKLSFLILILFISLISQIGDLIISYFKRKAKVKDTGKILPGHGGLLDRIDGLIFAIPVSLLIFTL